MDDRGRFERIYEDTYASLLGYALRRTDTADDAADVVAETFLTAWRRLDEVPEGERGRMWLYGAARKVVANQHRARRRQRRLAEQLATDLPRLVGQATPPIGAGEDAAGISAAFNGLGREDREVLLLAGWEGFDPGEVAEVVGCSRVAARVRLHRARKRFTQALEAHGVQRSRAGGHEIGAWAPARPGTEETR